MHNRKRRTINISTIKYILRDIEEIIHYNKEDMALEKYKDNPHFQGQCRGGIATAIYIQLLLLSLIQDGKVEYEAINID